ncbi:protein Skeletor, isoforms B/C-like [Amblyomma americanum]
MTKVMVVVLSAVLFFAFVAVLAVLFIGSHASDSDDNVKGNGGDIAGDAAKGGMPATPVSVQVPPGPRRETPVETVTPDHVPQTRTPRPLSPTHPPGVQSCPVDGYHGKRIGQMYGYSNDLSGFLYAASDNIVIITGLNYDGKEPAAHFWAQYSQVPVNEMVGDELPDENGSNGVLPAYKNATVQLKLPKVITAYQSLGIFSTQQNKYFGYAWIPRNYELPKQQALENPISRFGNVNASEIVLTDSTTMRIKNFVNHGHCPHTYFVAAPTNVPNPEELTYLIYDGNKMGELESYNGTDLTIQLPEGCHWSQFKWFSAFCVMARAPLLDVDIERSASHRVPLHSSKPVFRS